MFEFLQDIDNYDSRKVSRTEVNGLIVSTAHTSDEGYETALLDDGTPDVHPVERYKSRELAEAGHKRWMAFAKKAKNGTKIKKLGAWGIVPDSEIMLTINLK